MSDMLFKDWVEEKDMLVEQRFNEQVDAFIENLWVLIETFTGDNDVTLSANLMLWGTDLENSGELPVDAKEAGYSKGSLRSASKEAKDWLFSYESKFPTKIRRLVSQISTLGDADQDDLSQDVTLEILRILGTRGTSAEGRIGFEQFIRSLIKRRQNDLITKKKREPQTVLGQGGEGEIGPEDFLASQSGKRRSGQPMYSAEDPGGRPTAHTWTAQMQELVTDRDQLLEKGLAEMARRYTTNNIGSRMGALLCLFYGKQPIGKDENGVPTFAFDGRDSKNPDYGGFSTQMGRDLRTTTAAGRLDVGKTNVGLAIDPSLELPSADPKARAAAWAEAKPKLMKMTDLVHVWNALTGESRNRKWIEKTLTNARTRLREILKEWGARGPSLADVQAPPEQAAPEQAPPERPQVPAATPRPKALVPAPKPEPAPAMTEPGAPPKPMGTRPVKTTSMGDALKRALAARRKPS